MTVDEATSASLRLRPGGADANGIIRQGLLNPDLDLASLAIEFADKGIVQVEQALRPAVADLLYSCLAQDVPWSLAYRDATGPRKLWAEERHQEEILPP